MRRITIRRAHPWHYGKMRHWVEPSNLLGALSPFQSWPGYLTDTAGYNFRKGQVYLNPFSLIIRGFDAQGVEFQPSCDGLDQVASASRTQVNLVVKFSDR